MFLECIQDIWISSRHNGVFDFALEAFIKIVAKGEFGKIKALEA